MSPDSLLSPKDVAERLSLSLTAVYDLCKNGDLPCRKIGAKNGRIKIELRAVESYLARALRPVIIAMPRRRKQAAPLTGLRHLAAYRD